MMIIHLTEIKSKTQKRKNLKLNKKLQIQKKSKSPSNYFVNTIPTRYSALSSNASNSLNVCLVNTYIPSG